jgi:hypothetical protein
MVWLPVPAVAGLKLPLLTPLPLYTPPVGAPLLRVNEGVLAHTALILLKLAVVTAFTVWLVVVESLQLLLLVYTYFMVWLPAPAVAGLKLPLLTPVPLYTPPVGAPLLRVNEEALAHTALILLKLAVVTAFTVIPVFAELVQPFKSV